MREEPPSPISDLDLLLRFPAEARKRANVLVSSYTVLDNVRIRHRPASRKQTMFGRDKQAIVIDYADGTRVDLVPAFFLSFDKHPVSKYRTARAGDFPDKPAATWILHPRGQQGEWFETEECGPVGGTSGALRD